MKGYRNIDEAADIAILQFDATETPAVGKLGDSGDLFVGEEVYAIGTPADLPATVSEGNVSNPRQTIGGRRFVQFTAPISPGSSGGGLFDENGAVVGITTAYRQIPSGSQAGGAQNLNLAVPINDVRDVLTSGATAIVRESPTYYYSLGSLADNKREWDKAIQLYGKAVSIDENYTDGYLGLGGDYYEKGQFDLEVENYSKAVESSPNNAYARYLLGTAYEDTGQYAKAASAYETALKIDPNYKDALHDMSVLYLALGRVSDVQDLMPKLRAADPGWATEVEMLTNRVRTASSWCSGERWAYHSVISMPWWPISFCTVLRSTQAMTRRLAKVCRRSCRLERKTGRLLRHPFRGLLSIHARYRLHAHRVAVVTLCSEGFSDFVTSATASIVWAERTSFRAGLSLAVD